MYYLSEFYTEGSVNNPMMLLMTPDHLQQPQKPFVDVHHQSNGTSEPKTSAKKFKKTDENHHKHQILTNNDQLLRQSTINKQSIGQYLYGHIQSFYVH